MIRLFSDKRGISAIIVLLAVLALAVGGTAGYFYQKQKVQLAETPSPELETSPSPKGEGLNKFELEGTVETVDPNGNTITVKIQAATNSIKLLGLASKVIKLTSKTKILDGNEKTIKLEEIPLLAKVHIGGEISGSDLVADKIILQKESPEGKATGKNKFELQGTVKSVATNKLTVTVKAASTPIKDKRGTDVEIGTVAGTLVIKSNISIALTDIKADDKVHISGIINKDGSLSATLIIVQVTEKTTQLQASPTPKTKTPSPEAE